MTVFQRIRDGEGINLMPLLRSLWGLLKSIAVLGLLVVAILAYVDHDYARAAFDIALAIFIQLPTPSADRQP